MVDNSAFKENPVADVNSRVYINLAGQVEALRFCSKYTSFPSEVGQEAT